MDDMLIQFDKNFQTSFFKKKINSLVQDLPTPAHCLESYTILL